MFCCFDSQLPDHRRDASESTGGFRAKAERGNGPVVNLLGRHPVGGRPSALRTARTRVRQQRAGVLTRLTRQTASPSNGSGHPFAGWPSGSGHSRRLPGWPDARRLQGELRCGPSLRTLTGGGRRWPPQLFQGRSLPGRPYGEGRPREAGSRCPLPLHLADGPRQAQASGLLYLEEEIALGGTALVSEVLPVSNAGDDG